MSDNRKYYYLKLKENFYNSETMVILESMQDGLLYSNLLLKMYLMSLKSGGILMLNDHLPHTPQTIATEGLLCTLDETTVLRGSGPLPDAGAHILACFASFGPALLAYRENNWDLTSRVTVTAFGENSLSELESYEKVLELALPLGRELPSDAELIPECWLRAEDLRCVCANGTLEVNLSVKAEGAILQRSGNTCVGSIALGEPLTPADPEISLRIYYAQAGEELFAIARRFHVSPAQMLAANDLAEGTTAIDAPRRLLVPGAGG